MPPRSGRAFFAGLLFALLVCYRARSLACGLAGSLALSASAFFSCFFKVCRVDGFDMLHWKNLLKK